MKDGAPKEIVIPATDLLLLPPTKDAGPELLINNAEDMAAVCGGRAADYAHFFRPPTLLPVPPAVAKPPRAPRAPRRQRFVALLGGYPVAPHERAIWSFEAACIDDAKALVAALPSVPGRTCRAVPEAEVPLAERRVRSWKQ